MRRAGSSSRMRSTSRNGERWGRIALMSSISSGSLSGASLIAGRSVHRPKEPRRACVLTCSVPRPPGVETGPPLPGELRADLLARVGEINAVLDPEELFVPGEEGLLVPAHVEGYEKAERGRFRLKSGEGIVGAAAAC